MDLTHFNYFSWRLICFATHNLEGIVLEFLEPFPIFVLPILTGLASFVVILVLTPFAKRLRLLDVPDHRKHHGIGVPMVGGVAIYIVIVASMTILDPPDKLSWLFFGMSILVAIGVLDDAFGLGVRLRFASQILATSVVLYGNSLWIQSLGPGLESLESVMVILGVPMTIFAIVGLTNAFNMADGLDGLASGHMLIGLLTLSLTMFVTRGAVPHLNWLMVLISTVFAFWLVNVSLTPLKRVFLGDAGSLLLGFIMSWTLIYYTQSPIEKFHPVAALWCVTVPVLDTIMVMLKRLTSKRPLFWPDRSHLHHILFDFGLSQRKVVTSIIIFSLAINAIGVWMTYAISPVFSLVVYASLLAIACYLSVTRSIERFLYRGVDASR